MRVLVTGGNGFIGRHIVKELLCNGHQVTAIDTNIHNHLQNVIYVKVSINTDLTEYMEGCDCVYHLAAAMGVDDTDSGPTNTLTTNIEGTANVLKCAVRANIKRFIYTSSSEVYGEPVSIPQNEETTPLNSRLPYAIVKNVGESYCKIYFKEKKLNYTIFRFFNTYGKRQTNDYVLSKFINLAKQNNDITIYGKGFQSRTFCYIDDNIEAVIKSFEENKFVNEIVNIGNNKVITILKLAKIIKKITKSKSNIINVRPLEEGDMKRRKPDLNKIWDNYSNG